MSFKVGTERPMHQPAPAARIKVECLRCGHQGMLLPGSDLPRYGIEPDAPIATFIKRLTCCACGSHSVRAFRSDR
jgi:hypothetical protein